MCAWVTQSKWNNSSYSSKADCLFWSPWEPFPFNSVLRFLLGHSCMWITASCSFCEEIVPGTSCSIIFLENPVTMYILTGHSQVDIIMIEIEKRICGQNTEKAALASSNGIYSYFCLFWKGVRVMIFKKQNTSKIRDKQHVSQFFKNITDTMKAWRRLINLLRKMRKTLSSTVNLEEPINLGQTHLTTNWMEPEHARFAEFHYSWMVL